MEHRLWDFLKQEDINQQIFNEGLEMEEEKVWMEVLPCGIFRSQGKKYFLIYPEPTDWKVWGVEHYPVFDVIPFESIGSNPEGKPAYSYPRKIVVKGQFIVEYGRFDHTILAWKKWGTDA